MFFAAASRRAAFSLLLGALFWFACQLYWIAPAWAQMTKDSPQSTSFAPYLDQAIERVTEFTLDNGLTFIVMENHQAPVVSFYTLFDVGGVDEPDGKTGVAHFLEHMAFKGTETIGTKDYGREKPLLAAIDRTFTQLKTAQQNQDTQAIAALEEEFQQLQQQAEDLVERNEFGEIIQTAGGGWTQCRHER